MLALKHNTKDLGRLKDRSDFLRVRDAKKSWVSKSFILQVADFPQSESILYQWRYGVTVTKKLEKSAVKRNRMKRRLRAAAQQILPKYAIPGKDFVFIARAETIGKQYDDLLNDLKWCLKRLECRADQS